jgi:hypothetical protein
MCAGVAPEAGVVFFSMSDSSGNLYISNWPGVLTLAYNNGARVFSLSLGNYVRQAEYDAFSHQTDLFFWNNPGMLLCAAAGNIHGDYPDVTKVLPTATAKNVLTVGAAVSTSSLVPQAMANYSLVGPCMDGRIKPEIVAPGNCTSTSRSGGYASGQGTSYATPMVAGCALLARQWLREARGMPTPSGALVKAVLINGAQPITAGAHPNITEGFGHVSLFHSLYTAPGMTNLILDVKTGFSFDGQEHAHSVELPAGVAVHVTLAYADYPALANELQTMPKLRNDLDLIVVAPDAAEFSLADRLNNVEHIEFATTQAGTHVLKVRAHKILHGPQPYALVMRSEPLAPVITSLRVENGAAEMTFFSRRDIVYEVLETTSLGAGWPVTNSLLKTYRTDPARGVTRPANAPQKFWTVAE